MKNLPYLLTVLVLVLAVVPINGQGSTTNQPKPTKKPKVSNQNL